MKNEWQKCVLLTALALGVPCASIAQEARAGTSAPTTPAPARDVASGQEPGQAGLLVPAVQKVRAAPAPQKGIEPDEIDARSRAADQSRASPAGSRLSTQQMMLKLKPRSAGLVAVGPGGSASGPTSVQAKPAEPPKYEIADCGTSVSPMICCHHEEGDGSSCNLFKILCGNAGGTAQGDGESAACSDW